MCMHSSNFNVNLNFYNTETRQVSMDQGDIRVKVRDSLGNFVFCQEKMKLSLNFREF